MPYTLYLSRKDGAPIAQDDWADAIGRARRLRLTGGRDQGVENPQTNERLFRPGHEGDAELKTGLFGPWAFCIWLRDGQAVANAAVVMPDGRNVVEPFASLAARLDAEWRGQEGELYD